MILYQLRCSLGHEFEAWFKDSAAYDEQAAAGHVSCPTCGDASVCKAPMAPGVISSKSATQTSRESEHRAQEVAQQILQAVNKLREHVEENCDYVGDQFADEARRIHAGKAEERGIYGEASDEETEELQEEGIDVFRLPGAPRRDN